MDSECTELRDFVDAMYEWGDAVFRAHRQWEGAVVVILVEVVLENRRYAKVLREFRDMGRGGYGERRSTP